MSFSNRLEALRKSRNLSQEELAKVLNIDRTSIAHYENSKNGRIPRPNTLQQIADYFDVSVDYLLARTEDSEVSASEERFISDTETLSLAELQKKYRLTLDGKSASEEEIEAAIEFIRTLRAEN